MSSNPAARARIPAGPAFALVLLAVAGLAGHARSQPARAPATPAPAPANAAAPAAAVPVPADPQRTTASFGDWTLRCERTATAAALSCEVAQLISAQGQTVAQIALGHAARSEPLRLTVLVPPNASFAAAPHLLGAEAGRDVTLVELGWRRCLPAGCIADAVLDAEQLRRLRNRAEPARLAFQDGAGRDAALPFSPRGLPQALDALLKEEGR